MKKKRNISIYFILLNVVLLSITPITGSEGQINGISEQSNNVLLNLNNLCTSIGFCNTPHNSIPIYECSDLDQPGSNYKIMNDLYSEESCITIMADNINLDGQGYTISGNEVYESAGIEINGYNNIQIKNVKIQNFWEGIKLFYSEGSFIYESEISNNIFSGIHLDNALNSVVRENSVSGSKTSGSNYAIVVWSSNTNEILKNRVEYASNGIAIIESNDNIILSNKLSNNFVHGLATGVSENNLFSKNVIYSETGHNIYISAGAKDNTYSSNKIDGGYTGIYLTDAAESNFLIENIIRYSDVGITLTNSAKNNIFENNQLLDTINSGISLNSEVSENEFHGTSIVNSAGMAIFIGSVSHDNLLNDISVIEHNKEFPEIATDFMANNNVLRNTFLNSYQFNQPGTKMIFDVDNMGSIEFLESIYGSDTHLSQSISISNNLAIIDASNNPGLDKQAKIKLFARDQGRNLKRAIFNNGVPCSLDYCEVIEMTSDEVIFTVMGQGSFTIESI